MIFLSVTSYLPILILHVLLFKVVIKVLNKERFKFKSQSTAVVQPLPSVLNTPVSASFSCCKFMLASFSHIVFRAPITTMR